MNIGVKKPYKKVVESAVLYKKVTFAAAKDADDGGGWKKQVHGGSKLKNTPIVKKVRPTKMTN